MPKATVLCVDDDPNQLIKRQILLRKHGYHALITTNERKGFALLATLPLDAVVVHVQGPAAKWKSLTTKMKKLRPRIPVVLLTPGAQLPESARSVDAFLSDTESTDKLLEVIDGLLNSRSSFFTAWLSDWKRRSAA
jgi:DNA-binding NtrC family response regulator